MAAKSRTCAYDYPICSVMFYIERELMRWDTKKIWRRWVDPFFLLFRRRLKRSDGWFPAGRFSTSDPGDTKVIYSTSRCSWLARFLFTHLHTGDMWTRISSPGKQQFVHSHSLDQHISATAPWQLLLSGWCVQASGEMTQWGQRSFNTAAQQKEGEMRTRKKKSQEKEARCGNVVTGQKTEKQILELQLLSLL